VTGHGYLSASDHLRVIAHNHGTDFVLEQVQYKGRNLAAPDGLDLDNFVKAGAAQAINPGHAVADARDNARLFQAFAGAERLNRVLQLGG